MPVQINEQNLTIYNVTICNLSTDDAHKHVGKFLLLCYTVSENIDQLLFAHECAPLIPPPFPSLLHPLIGSQTYIYSVAFETEDTEQIQMTILAGLYY